MRRVRHWRRPYVPPELLGIYVDLTAKRPDLAELPMALDDFVPRFDVLLSVHCHRPWRRPAHKVDLRHYVSGDLLGFATWMQRYGYWGHYGHTVNISEHLLVFPASGVSLLWIPKNACTSIKSAFLRQEPAAHQTGFEQHRFHESVQNAFGVDLAAFATDDIPPIVTFLREPHERLVSCYLDKFLKPAQKGGDFEDSMIEHIQRAHAFLGIPQGDIARSLSFSEFVAYITACYAWRLNSHWRPQADFIHGLGARGLRVFRLDRLADATAALGVDVGENRDNRSLGRTFLPQAAMTGEFADLLPVDVPLAEITSYNQFFTQPLLERLAPYLEADLRLFAAAA